VSSPEEGKERESAPYRPDTLTIVNAISYDFRTRIGRLAMPPRCCPDMDGCIRLFQRIDPDVARIETVAGAKPDTVYARGPHGWRALAPRLIEGVL
jgi:hypothetical protein